MSYENLNKIHLETMDEDVNYYYDEMIVLNQHMLILLDLKNTHENLRDCFEDNYNSDKSLLKAEDYDLIRTEISKRKDFLMKNYYFLFFSVNETRSELYCKSSNAKSLLERMEPLTCVEKKNKLLILNKIENDLENKTENYIFSVNEENDDIYTEKKEEDEIQKGMHGFFDEMKEISEYIKRIHSVERQIYMEYNEVKLLHSYAMSFWQLYFLKHQYDNNQKINKTSQDLCKNIRRYGFFEIENKNNKKISEYTLHDLNVSFQRIIEYHYYIFGIKNNHVDVFNEVMKELNTYINVLFYRYSIITNKIEDKIQDIDVKIFIKKSKDGKNIICNLNSYFHFITLYTYLKALIKPDYYYYQQHFTIRNMTLKYNNEKEKVFQNLISFAKGYFKSYKPEVTNQLENIGKKMIVPTFLKNSYFYSQWFSKECNMREIFNSFNDESNYHNTILNYYFPTVKEQINDLLQIFCIKPAELFEYNEKEKELIKEYGNCILNKKLAPKFDLIRPVLINTMVLVLLNTWFSSYLKYENFLYRYVILDNVISTYGNFYELINNDIHNEPYIIRRNVFQYDVIYKKDYYYCNGDIFKTICIWSAIMKKKCDNKIKPIKFHTNINNLLDYYPWVYSWYNFSKNKVNLFKSKDDTNVKDETKSFYDSLTDDLFELPDIFYNNFEDTKKDQELETEEVVIEKEISYEEFMSAIEKMKNKE